MIMKSNKLLSTIFVLIIASALFLAYVTPSYAYWEVFGLKIPTNFGEFKTLILVNKQEDSTKTEEEMKERIQQAEEFKEKLEDGEINQEQIKKEIEKKANEIKENQDSVEDNNQDNTGQKKVQTETKNYAKEGLLNDELTFKASEIESLLDKSLAGKTYFNYTVNDTKVEFENDKAYLTLYLNDGKAVQLEITSNGNLLEVTNVKDVGTTKLSFFESMALNQGLKSLPSLVDSFVPEEYRNKIESITITPEGISVDLAK